MNPVCREDACVSNDIEYCLTCACIHVSQTARLSGCSMDALKLVSCWDKGRLKSAALPVTVEGLR